MLSVPIVLTIGAYISACGSYPQPTPRDPTAGPSTATAIHPLSPPVALTAPPTTTTQPPAAEATPLVGIVGVFHDRRETRVDDDRAIGPDPPPPAWDPGHDIVIDTVTGNSFAIGGQHGFTGAFNATSTVFAWNTAVEVMVMDLPAGTTRTLALGVLGAPPFLDENHAFVQNGSITESVDLVTGEHQRLTRDPIPPPIDEEITPDGYVLAHNYVPSDQPPQPKILTDPRSQSLIIQIDAYDMRPAGHGSVVVATRPATQSSAGRLGRGTSNIFLIDIATGAATFVATTAFVGELPFAANDKFVVWTDSACDRGTARIYDRRTGRITRLDQPLWSPILAPGGNIVEGFLPRRVIDPVSLEVIAALPREAPPLWSPDYRYAALIGVRGDSHGPCMYF